MRPFFRNQHGIDRFFKFEYMHLLEKDRGSLNSSGFVSKIPPFPRAYYRQNSILTRRYFFGNIIVIGLPNSAVDTIQSTAYSTNYSNTHYSP